MLKLITSFDDFLDYTKGFLDEDALRYAKELLNNDADGIVELKKIARLMDDGAQQYAKDVLDNEGYDVALRPMEEHHLMMGHEI